MIIVTCINDKNHKGYTEGLLASCVHFGYQLETIYHQGNWSGHRLKDTYILSFLKTLAINEVVLFADGFDTLFVKNETEILQKYNQLNVPVLFSAEVNCYPYETFSYLHKPSLSKFQYLNSGGFMGRVGDILSLYNQMEKIESTYKYHVDNQNNWSNQYRWMKMYLFTEGMIGLDTNCEIFQTFGSDLAVYPRLRQLNTESEKSILIEKEIERVFQDFSLNGTVQNLVTNSQPCHLHFISLLLKNYMFSDNMRQVLTWM